VDAVWKLGIPATGVDAIGKRVLLADGEQLPFDRLLIATGTRARPWPNPDEAALDGVFTLRTSEDAARLAERLNAGPRRLLVIGAGFTGSEIASACRERGLEVTVAERGPAPLVGALGGAFGALSWATFAGYFQGGGYCPDALVISACKGASTGIGEAFASRDRRPKIIFGSITNRAYDDYAVAWAILYRRFGRSGVHREAAQKALRDICATVHHSFVYRRWDDEREKYLKFPFTGIEYEVRDVVHDEDK
jgi:hypothetical protein